MDRSVSYFGKPYGNCSHFLCCSSTSIYSAPSNKTSSTQSSESKAKGNNNEGETKDE